LGDTPLRLADAAGFHCHATLNGGPQKLLAIGHPAALHGHLGQALAVPGREDSIP